MKNLLFIIVGTILMVPIFAESWTVLVYMAADNNLWQNAVQDVNDMESVSIPGNLDIIVQTDMPEDSTYPGGQRRKIRTDSSSAITSTLLADLGSVDSGDPQTLKSFINWGFQSYPAQRKMLVIWGHGDNWFKQDDFKWICPDYDSQSLLSIADGDLKEALSDIPQLDILLFDACSMQSLEVLAEVMDAADYVVGSEELVPATGFPYQTMIPLFASGNVEQVATQITQEYLESYEAGGIQNPEGFTNPITCSVIETSMLPSLFADLRDHNIHWSSQANGITLSFRDDLWEMNTAYCDVDFGEMLSYVIEQMELIDPMYVGRLQQLQDKWQNCVVQSGSININPNVGSAAIWYPWHRQYFDSWWQKYRQLDFAQYRWLGFLNLGFIDSVEPGQPVVTDIGQILGTLKFKITQPADPDSLSYLVDLIEDGGPGFDYHYYYPDMGEESFWVNIPVSADGYVKVKCVDTAANWSDVTTFSYQLSESAIDMLVMPNPIKDRELASVKWFLPEGETGMVELTISNIRGQKVLAKTLEQTEAGEGIWLLSAESTFSLLGRGIYVLKMSVGNKHLQRKLTIL